MRKKSTTTVLTLKTAINMGRSKKKILAMHAAKKPSTSFLRTMFARQEQRVIDLLLEMEIDANEWKVHYRYLPKDKGLTYSMKELDARMEKALQEEREGKTIPYDDAFRERMRKFKEDMIKTDTVPIDLSSAHARFVLLNSEDGYVRGIRTMGESLKKETFFLLGRYLRVMVKNGGEKCFYDYDFVSKKHRNRLKQEVLDGFGVEALRHKLAKEMPDDENVHKEELTEVHNTNTKNNET